MGIKRRGIIGGAIGLLAIGAGAAASETGLLSGSTSEVSPTHPSLGVFAYGTAGVNTVSWKKGTDKLEALAVIDYDDVSPPSFVRLTDPDGEEYWVDENPSGSAEISFTVPIENRGEWAFSVKQDGSWTTLLFPLDPSLSFVSYGLDEDTVTIKAANPTHTPNYIDNIDIMVDRQFSEEYVIEARIMPGDSFTLTAEYPFDRYGQIQLILFDGVKPYKKNTEFR